MKKKRKLFFVAAAILIAGLAVSAVFLGARRMSFLSLVNKAWAGYQDRFIASDGRVLRPQDGDTVSEGQAYALLRAVWMRDKAAFDKVYRWTEDHLSRLRQTGDHLLAWRWKDGRVLDWMPASDADIDYALALIFAAQVWPAGPSQGLPGYREKALLVLGDVLKLETYRTPSGRLYLSPWILNSSEAAGGRYPVNPSYYSPAHFRIFYAATKDARWLDLVETTYFVLDSLARSFEGRAGVGLFPDWCQVDGEDVFSLLPQKSANFGWEALRIPIRVAWDYLWFGSPEAGALLRGSIGRFAADEYKRRGRVFCEYTYDGRPVKEYENPLFYAAYYCAVLPLSDFDKNIFLTKTGGYLSQESGIYGPGADYFVNSLSWVPDGIAGGVVRNLAQEGRVE